MLHLNVVIPLVVVTFFCLWTHFFVLWSVFHTHMALSHPWGISFTGLMWILVWVKCSSQLCINAYCINNVFFLRSQIPKSSGEKKTHFCVKTSNIWVLKEMKPNRNCWQDFLARAVLMSPDYFPSLIKGCSVKIQSIQGCDGIKWDTVMTLLSEWLIIQTQSWDRSLAKTRKHCCKLGTQCHVVVFEERDLAFSVLNSSNADDYFFNSLLLFMYYVGLKSVWSIEIIFGYIVVPQSL